MSVHELQSIDRCGLALDGTALLIVYCPGALGNDYSFEDLAEKIETYLEFVLEGQLEEQFPECKGRPVVFRMSCETWPHSQYKPRFVKMANQLSQYNIQLVVEVSNLRVTGGIYDYESIA